MTRVARIGVALVLAGVMLGGCHKQLSKSDDQRTAEGQVLKGSISDSMLPYDAVTSQPPIAPERATSETGGGKGDADNSDSAVSDGAASAGSTASSSEAPAAPAPAPAPTPTD